MIAALLGLLTFVLTPLVAVLLALPFWLLGEAVQAYSPLLLLARLFALQGLTGFFLAQFLLIAGLALTGDSLAALLSWRLSRSMRLAALTFVSAMGLQIAAVTLFSPVPSGMPSPGADPFQGRAAIGEVTAAVGEAYREVEITNRHPEFGPLHKRLRITVMLSVGEPGAYLVTVRYGFARNGARGGTPQKRIARQLEAGEQRAEFTFEANEAHGSYGYWAPAKSGGEAEVQLFYLASRDELLARLRADTSIDEDLLARLVEDEGLSGGGDGRTVNKFVARKTIQF